MSKYGNKGQKPKQQKQKSPELALKKQKFDTDIARIEAKLQEAKAKLDDASSKGEDASTILDDIKSTLQQLQVQLDSLEVAGKGASAKKKALQEKISNALLDLNKRKFNIDIDKIEAELKDAKARLKEGLSENSDTSTAWSTAKSTLDELQKRLEGVEEAGEDASARKKALQKKISDLIKLTDGSSEYLKVQKEHDESRNAYFKAQEELSALEKKIQSLNIEFSKAQNKLSSLERSKNFGKRVSGRETSIFDRSYNKTKALCDSLSMDININLRAANTKIHAIEILRKECEKLYAQKIEFEKELQKLGFLDIADLRKSENELKDVETEFNAAQQALTEAKTKSLSLGERFKLRFTGTREQKEDAKKRKEALKKAQQNLEQVRKKKESAERRKKRTKKDLEREVAHETDANLSFEDEKKKLEEAKKRKTDEERSQTEERQKKLRLAGISPNTASLEEYNAKSKAMLEKEKEKCINMCNQIIPVLKTILKLNPYGFPYIGQSFVANHKKYDYGKKGIPTKIIKETFVSSYTSAKPLFTALEQLFGKGGIGEQLANSYFTNQSKGGYGFKNFYQDISVKYSSLKLNVFTEQLGVILDKLEDTKGSKAPALPANVKKLVQDIRKDMDTLFDQLYSLNSRGSRKKSQISKAIARIDLAKQNFAEQQERLFSSIDRMGNQATMESFNTLLCCAGDFLEGLASCLPDGIIPKVVTGTVKMVKSVSQIATILAPLLPDGIDDQSVVDIQHKMSKTFKDLVDNYNEAQKILKQYIDDVMANNSDISTRQLKLEECLNEMNDINGKLLDFSAACADLAKKYKIFNFIHFIPGISLTPLYSGDHIRLLQEAKSLFKKICLNLMDRYGFKELKQMELIVEQ